ncbi:hypothetical protein [Actinomycetospora flava]|uniref:HEAT repeat domain-containing protein n=1 Tax=Actinomycetospora flava TaxID=3129232 RepID=A0ABU8M5D2_9PSEU
MICDAAARTCPPTIAYEVLEYVRAGTQGENRVRSLAVLLPRLTGPHRSSVTVELRDLGDVMLELGIEDLEYPGHLGLALADAGLIDHVLDLLGRLAPEKLQWYGRWPCALSSAMTAHQAERTWALADRLAAPSSRARIRRWGLARLAELDVERALKLLPDPL